MKGAARMLLIENTRARNKSYADDLGKRYEVVRVPSGKQALERAAEKAPAVIVLDAISMRTTGERICRSIRESLPQIPLIHLHPGSAKAVSSEADIVLFEPFTSRKLVNSIERAIGMIQIIPANEIVICGRFSIHPDRRILTVDGQETALTPKLAALIETFFRNPGQTLDRKLLMERVWDTNYMGDTRTLDVHIRWIRRAIEVDPGRPQYLKTVRGVGYRLDVSAETEPEWEANGVHSAPAAPVLQP